MKTYPNPTAATECIWHVQHFGRDSVPPGSQYWWSNKGRKPTGIVVFQLTTGGELLYENASGTQRVPAGHALLHAYDEPTAYGIAPDATETYESLFIALAGEGLQQHWNAIRAEQGDILKIADSHEIHTQIQQLCDSSSWRTSTDPATIGSLVYGFVMMLFRNARASRAKMMRPVDLAVNAILSNTAYDWSTKELAARYGVSREHLSRVFHEQTGQPPAAYLADARLRRALWLIKNTQLTITNIARQSGYASPHTLARQVRTATKQSPSALRSSSFRTSNIKQSTSNVERREL